MWPATPCHHHPHHHPPTSTHIEFHTCTSTRPHSHRPDEQIIRPLARVRSRQWLICQLPSRYLCSWLARRLAENHFVSSVIAWLSHHLPNSTTVNSYFYQTKMAVGILMNARLHNDKVTFSCRLPLLTSSWISSISHLWLCLSAHPLDAEPGCSVEQLVESMWNLTWGRVMWTLVCAGHTEDCMPHPPPPFIQFLSAGGVTGSLGHFFFF